MIIKFFILFYLIHLQHTNQYLPPISIYPLLKTRRILLLVTNLRSEKQIRGVYFVLVLFSVLIHLIFCVTGTEVFDICFIFPFWDDLTLLVNKDDDGVLERRLSTSDPLVLFSFYCFYLFGVIRTFSLLPSITVRISKRVWTYSYSLKCYSHFYNHRLLWLKCRPLKSKYTKIHRLKFTTPKIPSVFVFPFFFIEYLYTTFSIKVPGWLFSYTTSGVFEKKLCVWVCVSESFFSAETMWP